MAVERIIGNSYHQTYNQQENHYDLRNFDLLHPTHKNHKNRIESKKKTKLH